MNPEDKVNNKQDRREFINYMLTAGAVGFGLITVYPVVSFLKPPKQREVEVSSVVAGKINDFPVGGSKIIRFGNKPVIVLRAGESDFRAFSATCTHLDCTVQFVKDEGIILCACHNGKYDLHGRNISGPPPKPLEKFKAIIKEDELVVSKET